MFRLIFFWVGMGRRLVEIEGTILFLKGVVLFFLCVCVFWSTKIKGKYCPPKIMVLLGEDERW